MIKILTTARRLPSHILRIPPILEQPYLLMTLNTAITDQQMERLKHTRYISLDK